VYGNDALSLTGVGCSIDFIRDAGASNSNCSMAFRTNTSSLSGATTDGSVERMRISAAGNVGIGTTTPNSALTVSGSVGISGGMSLSGPMNMTGALSVSGRTLIDVSNGGFNVTGSASFNNSLGVLGALNVTGSMNLSGSMNMTGTLSVSGRMNFSGPVTVTGNISSSGDISGKSLIFSNGGSYVAGSIFSDSNWGCLIRPATSSPANNLFTFAAQDGVEKYVSIGNTGNLGVYVLNPRTRMDIRGPNALYNSDTVRLSIGVSNLILGQVSVIDTSVGPSGEYRGDLTFTTQQNNALSERMRIRYDGNIGIGITGPVSSLHIGNPTDSTRKGVLIQSTLANNTTRPVLTTGTNIGNYEIRAYGNTTSYASNHGFLRLSAGGGTDTTAQSSIDMCGFSTVSDMTNTIVMRTAGVERMRIIEGGNVGIGTTGPSQQLHVIGNILASGTITAGSDERFKENIIPIPNALGKVLSLSGVNFTRREDINKKLDIGLIAQNVLGVVPEAVAGTEENMYSVNYQGLVGLLVEAIKEQQNNIENLEHKLETLLSRMDALESK
jgi:hypothetical protein